MGTGLFEEAVKPMPAPESENFARFPASVLVTVVLIETEVEQVVEHVVVVTLDAVKDSLAAGACLAEWVLEDKAPPIEPSVLGLSIDDFDNHGFCRL